MGALAPSYGDYWIDYHHFGNPLHGVTRRWMETQDAFCADLAQLSTPPFAVRAFGFKTTPPALASYSPVFVVPA